jgi:hypothetical protein
VSFRYKIPFFFGRMGLIVKRGRVEIGLMVLVGLSMVTILVLVVTRPRGGNTDTSYLGPRLDFVNQTLGRLSLASESMLDVGQELRKVLSAPILRGGLGETLLEEMLSQTLPAGSYRTQHTFRNLRRVDAVIQLADGLVPVDAKFPFEGYRAMVESDPSERKSHRTRFVRDVEITSTISPSATYAPARPWTSP